MNARPNQIGDVQGWARVAHEQELRRWQGPRLYVHQKLAMKYLPAAIRLLTVVALPEASILICVGLLTVVAVGVTLWSLRTESPAVRACFVRYMDGGAVLNFTNQCQSALAGFAMNVVFCSEKDPTDCVPYFYLLPRCGTQLVVRPRPTNAS